MSRSNPPPIVPWLVGGLSAVLGLAGVLYLNRRRNASSSSKKACSCYEGVPDIEDLDPAKFGFERPLEGTREEMHGAGKPIRTHLFVSSPVSAAKWPSTASEGQPLPAAVAEAVKSRKSKLPNTTVTLYTTAEKSTSVDSPRSTTACDILVFPDMYRFGGVQASELNAVMDCLERHSPWPHEGQFTVVPLTGHYVFICCHKLRDQRCGLCGPVLVNEFRKCLKERGLQDRVQVFKVSHVGGHKYAGNVLVYSNNKCEWYGYVSPQDVPRIIDQDILNGGCVKDLWRARLGISEDETKSLAAQCTKK